MNLFNIPSSYIPTSEEMILLSDTISWHIEKLLVKGTEKFQDDIRSLHEVQRKLNLLDSVFRAAEELPWEEYLKQQIGKLDPRVLQMPKPEVIKVTEGRPPLPTDENGSFSVGKSLC